MISNGFTDEVRIFCRKIVPYRETLHQRKIRSKVIPDDKRHAHISILEPKRSEHQVASHQEEAGNEESVPECRTWRTRVRQFGIEYGPRSKPIDHQTCKRKK